jgi:DNA-binding GntR family transcriptional regulator
MVVAAETTPNAQPSHATTGRKLARILFDAAGDPRSRLSIREMAVMAATDRHGLTAALRALQADGLVRVERHRIVIADREALRSLAASERSKQ